MCAASWADASVLHVESDGRSRREFQSCVVPCSDSEIGLWRWSLTTVAFSRRFVNAVYGAYQLWRMASSATHELNILDASWARHHDSSSARTLRQELRAESGHSAESRGSGSIRGIAVSMSRLDVMSDAMIASFTSDVHHYGINKA